MTQDQALIPVLISDRPKKLLANFASVLIGTAGLALLAQISLPLPWTPIPITGQTFGVALIALTWGRKRALAVLLSYLAIGAMGLPVFAQAKTGLVVGPTTGYLVGMVIASFVMGALADKGWTKSFARTYLAAFIGSMITFSCGLFVLSFFIPYEQILIAGLLPFIPGDLIKTLAASALAYNGRKLA